MGFLDGLSQLLGGNINKISAKEAKENMNKNKKIQLIDVREKDEFSAGHIPKAKNIPLGIVAEKIEKYVPNKEETIYVYCHSGMRSAKACKELTNLGYNHVYNLGGIISWPYEIEK